jgi:hypothetical protein
MISEENLSILLLNYSILQLFTNVTVRQTGTNIMNRISQHAAQQLRRSRLVLLAAFLLTAGSLYAQNFQGGGNLLVGLPQGAFKDNVNRAGYGITGNIGLAPSGYAYMLGVEVGYMNYGTERRREPFSTTIPDVTVDVETTNNFVLGHIFLRLQPNSGSIRPYLEGALGGNYLFTTTSIKNRGNVGEEVASSTNLDDFAFSYGGGAGLLVVLARYDGEGSSGDDSKISELLLDVRCRYLAGSEAEYLKEGSIRRVGGQVVYDVIKSQTNLLSLQIGIAVRF